MRDFSIAYPTGTYYLENVVLAVRLDYLVVQLNERLFAGYKGWYLKSCSSTVLYIKRANACKYLKKRQKLQAQVGIDKW
ncbi:hypothetical protein KSB_19210 [Ktedonobacter robiniae]|uniref:Uncharacterized protein n=1 Tax=Ktedonobacter robiniae TaxID=2778365 RepID=A0ABQ3ULA9_9CHLR|nr:hypothetical protein KSB_19210 [Ktedonobacter robiniae]